MRATYREWCAQLERSAVPASLDHNDLHPHNVLGDAPHAITFYDWGDSVVAHPFAVMLVALTVLRDMLDVATDDPVVLRVRDAYLAEFASIAPDEDLVATLELACRVAKAARSAHMGASTARRRVTMASRSTTTGPTHRSRR